MRIFFWIFYIALFVAALTFALSNTEPVDVRFFPGATVWRAPLVVVILAALAVGVVVGLVASVPRFFRQRREISSLRKELKARGGSGTGSAAATDPARAATPAVAASPQPPTPPYGV
jgi:putative membrane protein